MDKGSDCMEKYFYHIGLDIKWYKEERKPLVSITISELLICS